MKSPWSTRLLWLFVAFISGIAWLSPAFGVPLVVSRQPAILNTCDYDGGSRMNAGYDGRHLFPAFHYGSAAVRISDREANQTAGTSGLFDKSTDFVAAKTEANVTRLGITRNNPADWRATRDIWDQTGYGGILSDANRTAIARGRTPVVDEAWISQFPEDAGLIGERIPMHHIGGGPITVPLPATRHLDAHMPGGFRYNPGGPGSALPAYPAPNP